MKGGKLKELEKRMPACGAIPTTGIKRELIRE